MEKHKSQALALAEKYCRENGISYAKLKEQRFECLDNFGCFLQSSEIEPQGLKNDMATMPKITLIFKIENGKVSFEQTEYIEKYIGKKYINKLKKGLAFASPFSCEDRTIEMFLRFRCLDWNTLGTIILHYSVSVFKFFYSVISISVPPIKTTLIFAFDSTATQSNICRTT